MGFFPLPAPASGRPALRSRLRLSTGGFMSPISGEAPPLWRWLIREHEIATLNVAGGPPAGPLFIRAVTLLPSWIEWKTRLEIVAEVAAPNELSWVFDHQLSPLKWQAYGNPKFVGNVRNRREITGPTTRSWHFRTLSDTGSANICAIPARASIAHNAAYLLILCVLAQFQRSSEQAVTRVRIPLGSRWQHASESRTG